MNGGLRSSSVWIAGVPRGDGGSRGNSTAAPEESLVTEIKITVPTKLKNPPKQIVVTCEWDSVIKDSTRRSVGGICLSLKLRGQAFLSLVCITTRGCVNRRLKADWIQADAVHWILDIYRYGKVLFQKSSVQTIQTSLPCFKLFFLLSFYRTTQVLWSHLHRNLPTPVIFSMQYFQTFLPFPAPPTIMSLPRWLSSASMSNRKILYQRTKIL